MQQGNKLILQKKVEIHMFNTVISFLEGLSSAFLIKSRSVIKYI